MTEHITCPLCKERVDYTLINLEGVDTHAWICCECPFVGIEYYSSGDTARLHEHLEL